MSALGAPLIFIVEQLLAILLFVFLMRLLLQLSRADFRNPLCQAVVAITNPLIIPLRRVLPPVGKIDTASVVAVLLVAFVDVAAIDALHGASFPEPLGWLRAILAKIIWTLLWTYIYSIFLYALLTLIAPGSYSPAQSVLTTLCEPVLRPIRRLLPSSIAGLDLSPLWAILLLWALTYLPVF